MPLSALLVLVTSASFLEHVEAGPKLYRQLADGSFERVMAADLVAAEAENPGSVDAIYVRDGDNYLAVPVAEVVTERVENHYRILEAAPVEAAAAPVEVEAPAATESGEPSEAEAAVAAPKPTKPTKPTKGDKS